MFVEKSHQILLNHVRSTNTAHTCNYVLVLLVACITPFPTLTLALNTDHSVLCQNLGAASSNRVRTRQDTMDVDNVLGR